jgi:uncharacterized membrane protein
MQRQAQFEETLNAIPRMVREFFTGGNTVVRVGLMVLLVGVVLLLKYAADHSLFPIEARMGSAAIIGLGLVAVGFWQRTSRPGFATTLQGGGVATTYLVVFFSMHVYELLPVPLGFGLLACWLSALQRNHGSGPEQSGVDRDRHCRRVPKSRGCRGEF